MQLHAFTLHPCQSLNSHQASSAVLCFSLSVLSTRLKNLPVRLALSIRSFTLLHAFTVTQAVVSWSLPHTMMFLPPTLTVGQVFLGCSAIWPQNMVCIMASKALCFALIWVHYISQASQACEMLCNRFLISFNMHFFQQLSLAWWANCTADKWITSALMPCRSEALDRCSLALLVILFTPLSNAKRSTCLRP